MNFIKMNQTNGYIYVRNHPSYDVNDACKMGKANNIPERDTQYATGEIKRGNFIAVFEVPSAGIIERLLQYEFRELNVYCEIHPFQNVTEKFIINYSPTKDLIIDQ